MQPDDIGMLEWVFKATVAGISAIGWYLWRSLVSDVKEVDKQLNAHQLHTSENYAKKTELTPIYAKLDDMQNDLKILVGMKREREK